MSDVPAETIKAKMPDYDSNPFTISFRGFGLFTQYAKGVLIAVIIFGLLGFFVNILTSIPDFQKDKSQNYSSYESKSDRNAFGSSVTNSNIGGPESSEFVSRDDISNNTARNIAILIIPIVFIVMIGALLIGNVFTSIVSGVLAAGAVSAINKKEITFSQAFSEMGSRFGVLYWANLIAMLKIIGGYFLFVVPGVRAQLRYSALSYVIMTKKDLNSKQAVANTKDLYRNHLMESFGINTVGSLIPIIGQAIAASGFALSVEQLINYKNANMNTPKTHWLNYIGLIFVLVIFFFVLMMFALAAILFARN